MKLIKTAFILSNIVCLTQIKAQVKLPALFSNNMVLQQKAEVNIWGWAEKGKEITLIPTWDNHKYTTKSDKNGYWKLKVKTIEAGGPYEITISEGNEVVLKNVLLGEVWLCAGQSNMEMPMKGYMGQPILGSNYDVLRSKNNAIRFISVPRSCKTIPQNDFEGEWLEAEPKTVVNFSATAYYFARLLNEILDVPVGLVEVSYGGSCVEAWMSKEISGPFNGVDIPRPDDSTGIYNRTPISLFNGMLHPVIGYGIKGAIWYQGETNFTNSDEYAERFSAMVKEWRSLWQQGNFPFYYTQIAPFDYRLHHRYDANVVKHNSAYLREAQLKAMDLIPNSGMAVLMDVGEEKSIHPKNKKKVGERLAFWALGKTYGIEGIAYKSPTFKDITIEGSTVTLPFDNVPNGLTSFGKEIILFEIAGEDKKFYPADANLKSKSVVISSVKVPKPVAVRYAFKNFADAELFNTEGIPVSSFRTDEW